MKRTGKLLPALLIVGILAGCAQQPVPEMIPAAESNTVSSEAPASSIPAASSEASKPTSSAPKVSSGTAVSSEAEEVSSEAVSSAPASSEAVFLEVLPPVESEEIPELACPLASSQAEAPASSQTQPPTSSEAASSAPPASSTVSEYVVPEDERPMTEAEVDALIAEAIAYAESKGMTWKDDYSLSNEIQGYNPPGHSEWGYRACKETVLFNIEQLCCVADEDIYWQEGMEIWYKIEKGRIEPFEGWFIYVLY